jgi:hypothetical protein
MKFLIQKTEKQVRHDFAFTLLEASRFNDWLLDREKIVCKFINTEYDEILHKFIKLEFKPQHLKFVPIGSVEFVTAFLQHFYDLTPKPLNIPNELLRPEFTQRFVFNGTENEVVGTKFIKSNDRIKGFTAIVNETSVIPEGNYQISDVISIDSEWRAFVYRGKLRGLQNYAGEFTRFPDVDVIHGMIKAYKDAPTTYTLDVAVCDHATVIIEVHDFFSCGLYGFADLNLLPRMFYGWFWQYLQKEMYNKQLNK